MMDPALIALGWTAALASAAAETASDAAPCRVAMLHKSRAVALGAAGPVDLVFAPGLSSGNVAVGDWGLARDGQLTHILPRHSLLQRRAAGTGAARQWIAANVDLAIIVTACGADFNPARIERFMVLALSGGIQPLIALTKADLSDRAPYLADAIGLAMGAPVLALNAKTDAARLLPHIGAGQTAVLLGSSGVGKSTLANGLIGAQVMATGGVRAGDDKGRHTTTARHLLALPNGGWLIDTPGLREVQLAEAEAGIDALFADILDLAPQCRFRNCTHLGEPGCAVQAAVKAGALDALRLERWRKLVAEEAANAAGLTAAETRAGARHNRKTNAKHSPR